MDKLTKARKVRRIRDSLDHELMLRRYGLRSDSAHADKLHDELCELARQEPYLTLADVYGSKPKGQTDGMVRKNERPHDGEDGRR